MPDPQHPDHDLAPVVGAETDVARLGSTGPLPAHEQTADQDTDFVDWERVAAMPEFRRLLRDKAAFVVPTTAFFVVYYFALPILVGWFPELTRRRIGPVNFAYVFALSQFFMAWTIAFLYLRKATGFDAQAADILARIERAQLERSDLERAQLDRSDVERAQLERSELERAQLERSDVERAQLERTPEPENRR